MAEKSDNVFGDLLDEQPVNQVELPLDTVTDAPDVFGDLSEAASYDPTDVVPETPVISPEQEKINEDAERQLKRDSGIDVSLPKSESFESPVFDAVELPTVERQESVDEILRARDEAIEANEDQIYHLMKPQGFSDEEINQVIEEQKKEILSTTGQGGSRMMSLGPTQQMFLTHLDMVKAQTIQDENIWDSALRFFSNEIDPSLMTTFAAMRARGIVDFVEEAKIREAELLKEGLSKEDAENQVIAEFDARGVDPVEATRSDYQKELRTIAGYKIQDKDLSRASYILAAGPAYLAAKKGLVAGATYGARIGKGPGAVIGGIGGALISGASVGILTKMAVMSGSSGRFDYDPEDEEERAKLESDIPGLRIRRTANSQVALAQSIVDDFGVPANVEAYLEVATAEEKAELITRAITLADEYGISEKLRDNESLKSLVDVFSTAQQRSKAFRDMGFAGGTTPLHGFAYSPTVRHYVKSALESVDATEKEIEAVQYLMDAGEFIARVMSPGTIPNILEPYQEEILDFGGEDESNIPDIAQLIVDIGTEIAATDQYREQQAAKREAEIKKLREKTEEFLRERKVSFEEKTEVLEWYSNVRRGFIETSDFDYKFRLQSFVDSHNWNDANPKWRGEQPDAERFTDFVQAHLLAGGKRQYSDPLMNAAIKSVIDEEPKEDLQRLLNKMNLKTLREIGGNNIKRVWESPSIEEIEDFMDSMETTLTQGKGGGRAASREMQKMLELETMNRKGTFYEPSFFNKLLGYASLVPTTLAEIPVSLPDHLKPIVESMGLPSSTPAYEDFEKGLGIRPLNSTVYERVIARRRTLTGGFQLGFEENKLAEGYQRHDPEFNKSSAAGFVLDMLNFEKYGGKAIGNAARIGWNTPSAIGATFKSGTPASRTIQARNELLKNTSFDRTTDPVVSMHQAQKVGAQEDLNSGINPVRKHLTPDEQDLFDDVLTMAGRDPREVRAALDLAAGNAETIKNISEGLKERLGPNDLVVLRNHPEYKRLHNDVFNLVRKGKITADDANRFLAILEDQAIRIAELPDNPYRSAVDVISNLEIVTNRPAGTGARFMGKGLEEVDTAPKDPFSQPLRRDISIDRIRAILDDVDIDESDPKFVADLKKKFNVEVLEDLSDTDRVALKEEIYRGKMSFSKPAKPKKISKPKIVKLQQRYSSKSYEKAPGPLTRTSRVKAEYKAPSLRQKTTAATAAKDFELADTHSRLIGDRNPILTNKDWNQYWGGVTGTKQILEPPLRVRQYSDPEVMAAELRKLTPEQKRRADSGIVLVEQLGALYESGRADPTLTAQLLGWTILSRSLSAFPHESAFLDAFLSAPPASIFSLDFDGFIKRSLEGTFDEKALLAYDVWIGGIHRRRAADKLLADGEISAEQHRLFVGQNKDVVDSLVSRKIIEEADAEKFLLEPLPKEEKNKKFNQKVVEAMSDSRKLAESLRRQELITPEEFNELVGFHPALRIEGMGNPAAANLRDFGRNFLRQSSERLPEGTTLQGFEGRTFNFGGQTKLEAWHNILLDMSISGQEARRLYHQIYQGAGIDNKVISFMLLAAGRKDVIVIDRIQANHFWGAAENLLGKKVLRKDGSKIDLYEGFSSPKFKDIDSDSVQSWAKNPRPYSTTRGLADVLNGARGVALYEAVEKLLGASLDEAYRLAGREGQGSLGRFHWETWVIRSGQEVGHDTLNVLLNKAQGFDDPAVGAFVSEGKFQMRRYGMKYAVLPDNQQAMVVATQDGKPYLFNPSSWAKVVSKLTRDGTNVSPADGKPRIVPKGWKLENEKFANTPWYHRASVNRDNLDIAIREHGTAATPEQVVALERFAGGDGTDRVKGRRVREDGIDDKTLESVEPTVIRLVDPDSDTKYQRKDGVPLGYFEYDQRTRIAIINLFEKGDLDTLWHENGHFMATLMGEQYKNNIFKHFDFEIDETGSRKLTDVGHEQFAEAWRYYRRVRDYPDGYLRRLFDELWIALHNLWSKIRRKPGLLPDEVREYWDLEFGSLPQDRRSVNSAVSGAMYKKKSRSMTKRFDPDDLDDGAAVSRAQLRVAKDLGYDENTIRSLLGDRPTNTVRSQPDLQVSPGEQPRIQRVVERTFEPRSYDAVDAGLEIFALIKNSKFRKDLSGKKLSTVGTGRYQVPTTILKQLTDNVNTRMTAAIGMQVAKFRDKLFYPDKTGINAIGRRQTIPEGVNTQDIAAFQKRLKVQNPERDPQTHRSSVSFFVLTDREQAGFKTLIQELARQPEADSIPFGLLDPDVNLKLLSIDEYNFIHGVLTDVTATPLQRRNRNQVHPGYLQSFAAILGDAQVTEAVGDIFKDIGRFFGKKPKLDRQDLDPQLVDILEGFGRRAIGSGEDLVRYSKSKKFGPEDDLYNFFGDVVDSAAPRVSLANLTGLQKIHQRLSGTVRNMTLDAAERAKSDVTTGANRPVTYDPIVTGGGKLTIETISQDIPLIQDLLDGPFGMTAAEREAIIGIRSVHEQMKRGRSPSDFTPEERTVIGSAIEILHLGIDEKYQYVKNQAERIYERVMAVEGVVDTDFRKDYVYDIYRNFYSGNFLELFKMAGNIKNVRQAPKTARRTYNLGFLNRFIEFNLPALNKITRARTKRLKKEGLLDRTLGGTLPEYEQSVIALMILTKMDELKQDLASELVRYGFVANRRKIVSDLGLLSDVSVSTERYLDRVQFYVNRTLQYGDITKIPVDDLGKRAGEITYAKTAKEFDDLYGPAENPKTFRGDAEIINRLDLTALHEADQIIARLGIKPGRGTLETVDIGGQLFFMPKVAVEFLEDHIQQTFPKTRLKKTWGQKGKVVHRLTGRIPERTLPKKIVDMAAESASSLVKVGEFLISPRSFYTGLLIGTGGLPMVGYGMGVFIGGLSQLHLGKGATETIKAAAAAPATLAEALPFVRDLSEAVRGQVGFSAAVLARIHGRGSAKPFAKAIVLADGRIITADMVAESVRKHGWKSAFVDVIKNPDTFENLYNRFNKTNPTLANTVVFGAGGAPYGVTSAVLSAALGASVGEALKPGNIFGKLHRNYAEAFAAIDSYLRIRVLLSELNEGKALEDAAPKVRDIMLDYSAMSDAERAIIARYFAFWSYFSQANKLFFTAAIENPDRIVTQLKFALNTQRTITQGRDPDKFLPPWDRYRSSIPFKIDGHYFRLPFLITGDTLGMLSELATVLAPFEMPDEARKKASLAITGRLSPQIGLGIATVLGVDPGLGFPLDRATLQVPAELIEIDALLFGGALWDYLEIKYVPPDKIKMVFDDPEKGKVRINPNNIESPGQGIWISQSPVKYYYLMNYLQTPLTGRMGDNMWALSRANAGPIAGFVDGLEYVKATYSPDKPIMANFGVLNALSVMGLDIPDKNRTPKGDDEALMPGETPYLPPSAVVDPNQQLVTAPLDLLKQAAIAYEGEDGTVEVYTNRFFWPELGRIVGMTRVPNRDEERPAVMEYRRHMKQAQESARKQERQTSEGIDLDIIGE